MQYPDVLTTHARAIGLALFATLFLIVFIWPYLRPKRKRRPKCELTPLEVRAHDTVDALEELEAAIAANTGTLPPEIATAWVKAKTTGIYLKRFLEEGR